MLSALWKRIEDADRRLRRSFGKDISTPKARRLARLHYHLFDHAFLRIFWSNFAPVAPGVWRSNQPTNARFSRYKAMGIKAIVNLRGEDDQAHYLFERESCEQLGLILINTKIHARTAASRRRIIEVIDALRTAPRPMLFHCKSGADRAGFVAAMYQMIFDDQPVEVAMRQLSIRFVHLSFTATGIQDYILRVYRARLDLGQIGFEEWIRTEYTAPPIQAGWDQRISETQIARNLMEGNTS